jgi:type I restriction enzyme S subunit
MSLTCKEPKVANNGCDSKLSPKLRFKEFNGEWEEKIFENIFSFSTGKNIKQNEASLEFEIPCVRYGELYHMYDEVISKIINRTSLDKSDLLFSQGNEILLPSAGEDPLDIGSASALTVPNVAIGRTINILRPLSEKVYSQKYVSYYINQKLRKKISTLAKGSSISNVYNSDLKKLNIMLPCLSEQEKIASFLTAINVKIESLACKEKLLQKYKKGVMQKIFNQEIRFKASDGSEYPKWEDKKLKEILDYEQPTKYIVQSTEYKNEYTTPVLTAGKTFVLGYTNEKNGIYKDCPVIIFDDFTTANHFVDFEFKVKSSAMKLLRIKDKSINLKFVYESMQRLHFPIGEHKRYWISEYSFLKIGLPCLKEQTKIANFLSTIDKKLLHVKIQLEKTKEFKKALLQQMFV